jgi:hypothetical protein
MKYHIKVSYQVVTDHELINTFPTEGEARRHCAALNAAASGGIVGKQIEAGAKLAQELAAEKRFDNPMLNPNAGIVQPYPRGRWSTPEPSKTVDIPPQQMIEPEDFRD